MLTPTFLNVGESNKVSLADLKVTGYDPAVYEMRGKDKKPKGYDGCSDGQFIVLMLTANGTQDGKGYEWLDYYDKNGNRIGPGWFYEDGTEIEGGGAAAVKFSAGKGLWIQGTNLKLQPAGAVNPFDISFKTEELGKSAVGNCTPVNLTLAELTVSGYDPAVYEMRGKDKKPKGYDGCSDGQFIALKLTPNGTQDGKGYEWLDYYDKNGNRIGPGWFYEDGTEIEGGASTVSFNAGESFWIQGSAFSLVIPAPEL